MGAKPVTYPKELRDAAKESGRKLCTIDVPGMRYQWPATDAEAKEVGALMLKILASR